MIVGIAMSTYNRPDDVLFNVRLVRELWPETRHEYRLYLCHNNPGMRDTFNEMIHNDCLDGVVEGRDLPYEKGSSVAKQQIRSRQVNCWQTGVQHAIASGCQYAIHFHADAYILKPDWLESQIDRMNENGLRAAGRGYGLTYRGPKVPDGDIDDHFFIVSEDVPDSFFEPIPFDIAKIYASEGWLANRMRTVGIDRFDYYDDLSNNEHGRIPRSMHPYNYDPDRFLLHTPDLAMRNEYVKRVYPDFEE